MGEIKGPGGGGEHKEVAGIPRGRGGLGESRFKTEGGKERLRNTTKQTLLKGVR